MFAIIQAAGWPIWLLIIASIVAIALIIERGIAMRPEKIAPPYLLQEVIKAYRGGQINQEVIRKLELNSPLGLVLAAGLRNVSSTRDVMRESIEAAGQAASQKLGRYLVTLGTIASLAPLMGLFGTVIGMIEIFGAANVVGTDPAQLGHGISVALYNTAFGLLVAMPTLFFYRYYRGLSESFLIDMEQQAVKFVDTVHSNHVNAASANDARRG